ncbi:MAG: hypothetical protein U0Z75_00850 [Deinococcaceae bacterium]
MLKIVGIIGITMALMAIENVSAEDQPVTTIQKIALPLPIPVPGGGPIGTTNWGGGGGSGGTSDPCVSC